MPLSIRLVPDLRAQRGLESYKWEVLFLLLPLLPLLVWKNMVRFLSKENRRFLGHSYNSGRSVNWYNVSDNSLAVCIKSLNVLNTLWQSSWLPRIPVRTIVLVCKYLALRMFHTELFIMFKNRNHLSECPKIGTVNRAGISSITWRTRQFFKMLFILKCSQVY